jgi:proteasome assembly chaperone (PAC2) family protein
MHAELLRSQDKENIFVLSGDTQPLDVQGMYQLAGEILQAIESEGVTDVITLAAFVGDATAKILGSATDPESAAILHDSGIPLLRSGAIGGMNGLLAGLAPLYNMRGYCLLGTSSGADLIDIAAATNLLYAIRDLFKLDLDFSMMESILDEPDEPVPEEVDMNYC